MLRGRGGTGGGARWSKHRPEIRARTTCRPPRRRRLHANALTGARRRVPWAAVPATSHNSSISIASRAASAGTERHARALASAASGFSDKGSVVSGAEEGGADGANADANGRGTLASASVVCFLFWLPEKRASAGFSQRACCSWRAAGCFDVG